MNISTFITDHREKILVEWEAFATTFGAVTDDMSAGDLRDHASQILDFVARDIEREETTAQTEAKSKGHNCNPDDSASSTHGKLRYASGFSLSQLLAEYRALRASVLKLWKENDGAVMSADGAEDIIRFNEAIDQSLADAAIAYSDKVNETRDTFLAILGHDLRSPLAATALAGTYLSEAGGPEDKIRQIGIRVKRSAATMASMVNDLLGLARTQLGDGIPIEREPCDLHQIGQWAVEDANAAHPRAHFEIKTSGELTGAFDAARLQQLLTNLANNAAQYGAPGKPIVVDIAGEKNRVMLKVRNHGAIIPKDVLPTLFTSLVQLPEKEGEAEGRPRSSLGLGLFIAKQIAVAHGGDIEVVYDKASGTVFTVEVPRQ